MNDNSHEASVRGRARSRRRSYIVNPAFQWKYAGLIVAGVFVLCFIVSTVMYGALYQMARQRVLHLAESHAMANTFGIMLFAATFAVLMAAGFGLWSIVLTHRISGPLFVMRQALEALAKGQRPELRALRKRDEFKDLHDALRAAVDTLAAARQADVATIDALLADVQSAEQASSQEQTQALANVTRQLEQLRANQAAWVSAVQASNEPPSAAPATAQATENELQNSAV